MREEEGVLPLPSLMEAWRPPSGGKRTLRGAYVRIRPGGSGGGTARPMSMGQAEARAKLERIVRKAPEVMVKVSGKQYGATHVAEHFGYVARHGKLAVRSSEGEVITEPGRLKEIARDWAMLDEAMNEHGRDRPTSMSLVLSMPGGSTDAETLHDAAQAFARILFEGNHAYMLALHTDTDHPHVHLTVATEGADGTRFNPRKADLHHMRETFAQELRARGVAAEATPPARTRSCPEAGPLARAPSRCPARNRGAQAQSRAAERAAGAKLRARGRPGAPTGRCDGAFPPEADPRRLCRGRRRARRHGETGRSCSGARNRQLPGGHAACGVAAPRACSGDPASGAAAAGSYTPAAGWLCGDGRAAAARPGPRAMMSAAPASPTRAAFQPCRQREQSYL